MELNHLKYFYEVAKQGSFTKASKTLYVSQPSVSKLVKNLEDQMGVKLLDRFKRGGVSLTENGRVVFEHCQKIFREVESLGQSLSNTDEATGHLSIGASDSLCNYIFPKILHSFSQLFPKVRIKLLGSVSEIIKSEILESKIEMGIFHRRPKEYNLNAEKLGFIPFVVVCSSKNKIIREKSHSLGALEQLPYISPRVEDYADPSASFSLIRSLGIPSTSVIEASSEETRKKLVLEDCGFAVLPQHMVEEEISRGKLIAIRTKKSVGLDIFLVKRTGHTLSRAAHSFETHLKTQISNFVS